ncbi:hypothetical protein HAX54_004757 [Datura stramonium]|uniref:NAB domain-containing protein n=1 Tax=Datura stramonium TaxID=4076 RepID=A0ABS8T8T1_DATST|nr:hypothetical protein [Datura stramonium]
MLQRAATNAYSWWAASHIRTKQSKWLEQSLQDMEEKVEDVIKLIEEDGDSFAKRAEMYYKKRPELINFVEESYRAYRALAERYDKLSRELQSANNTIATLFPEQIQLAMDEEDDYGTVQFLGKKSSNKARDANKDAPKSGLTKDEALEEIDKLQRDILSLQTVKEFVKSSYQSGIAKTMEIEHQIIEKHQKICSLEDEFGEAREKQEQSTKEAKEEFRKIEEARKKLKSFRQKYLGDPADETELDEKDESAEAADESSGVHGAKKRSSWPVNLPKLTSVKPDEEVDETDSSQDEEEALADIRSQEEPEKRKDHFSRSEVKKEHDRFRTSEVKKEHGQDHFSTSEVKKEHGQDHFSTSEVKKEHGQDHFSTSEVKKEHGQDHFSTSKVEKEQGQDHFSTSEVEKQQGPVTVVSDKEVQEGTKTPKKHAELLQPTAAEKGEERVSSQSENSVHDEPKPQEDEEKDDDLTWQQMLLTDEEIESLRLKLSLLQGSVPVSSEPKEEKQQDLNPSDDRSLKPEDSPKGEDKDEQDFKIILIDQRASLSPVEEKSMNGN